MRVVWVSSAVLVLVLTLVLTPLTPSTAYLPPQEDHEAALRYVTFTSHDPTEDPPSLSTDTTLTLTSLTEPTTSPTEPTTSPSEPTTSPTEPTTSTEPTISTPEPTTSTPEPTTSSTTTPTIGIESSTSSSLSELEILTETTRELDLITEILNNFADLVSSNSARSVRGARGNPASWWQRALVAPRPSISSYNFCVPEVANDLCITLEAQMGSTDNLVLDLKSNVNDWGESDLEQLRQEREGLEGTYVQASDQGQDFVKTVKKEEFIQAIGDVKQNVKDGRDAVQERIDVLDPPDNPGSVALVATIGSIGGVMILSIIGVMIYGAVKQSKTKKKLSSGPKRKAKGEKIPIDAYGQDAAAGPRPAPRMDPYSQPPAPAPQSHHYAPQFDPRRDPGFPDAMAGRPQRGLRRTNVY